MAKLLSIGRIGKKSDPIRVYMLRRQLYVRSRSSLDGQRVKTSPEFSNTMKHAGILAQASSLASQVYRDIPIQKRKKNQYRVLTGEAIRMLRNNIEPETILLRLTNL